MMGKRKERAETKKKKVEHTSRDQVTIGRIKEMPEMDWTAICFCLQKPKREVFNLAFEYHSKILPMGSIGSLLDSGHSIYNWPLQRYLLKFFSISWVK